MRLTKIICTLGPASNSLDQLRALRDAGMDIARINFSHGDHAQHRTIIRTVKEMNAADGSTVALLLDTKGAEIRTGDVTTPIEITKGQEVVFSAKPLSNEQRPVIIVNYDKFEHDVRKAESILLDNGVMSFEVVELCKDGSVRAKSHDDGHIGSRRHVNLPGADISLPSMMESDWLDLKLGIEEGMDFVGLSFIRTADEVREVADFIKKHSGHMRTIAKIETRQAVANIDDIIEASDGIMVARGDLGAEMAFETIPSIQDMIVQRSRSRGKPVIVATQMLESMIENPMPTRAEVTDIAHAATTRADCTMLSGETAMGKHPVQSVAAMARILEETEAHQSYDHQHDLSCPLGERSALADSAVSMALATGSCAIIALTISGKTAEAVSQMRSNLPIFALTQSVDICRNMQILHGVQSLRIDFDADPETTIERALSAVHKTGLVKSGQKIVLISDTKTRTTAVHSVQVRVI